jgi:hypothetical protein
VLNAVLYPLGASQPATVAAQTAPVADPLKQAELRSGA